MGLFDNSDNDTEKSFRDRVEDEIESRVEEAKGGVSEEKISDETRQLAANAQGPNVEAEKLVKSGSGILDVAYVGQQPIIHYLQENEQPHYHFENGTKGMILDGQEIEADQGYQNSMLVTDQQIHFFAGSDEDDLHHAVDLSDVDSVKIDMPEVLGAYPKFILDVGGSEYRFTTQQRDEEELQAVVQYISDSDEQHLDLRLQAEPVENVQQWQYKTVDLMSDPDTGLLEKGLIKRQEQTTGPPIPSEELLNELGKEGWKLVETIEKPARKDHGFTDIERGGSMTYAFVFRRPVSYPEDSEKSDT